MLVKKSVSLLKLHKYIPEDLNLAQRLTNYFNPNDTETLKDFNDEMSVTDIHTAVLKKYFSKFSYSTKINSFVDFFIFVGWRFQCSEAEVEKLFKTYDRFNYKSLQVVSEIIDILTKELNFPYKKILQNGYLFDIHPKHIQRLFKHFPALGGRKIKETVFKCPKLLSVSVENIYEILEHLKVRR